MKREPKDESSLEELRLQSIAAIDDFEQKKEEEFVNLLVKLVMNITFNDYEKSDQVSPF
ncbi:MAG: hypothetical protein V4450_17320 [Bacteroidota bacterium]